MREFVYVSSPNDPPLPQSMRISLATSPTAYTPIDPRPQSMLDPQMLVNQPQSQPAYALPSHPQQDVKPSVSPISPHDDPRTRSFSPVSPLPPPQPVHQTPQVATQESRHARQLSNLSPINTNLQTRTMPPIPPTPPSAAQTSPLQHKAPITPLSAGSTKKDGPISPTDRMAYPDGPYSPHGLSSNQSNNMGAIFSPDAASGPNGFDFTAHQPGQITHPNMESQKSHEWTNSLCACSPDPSTCLTGLFCPCILYGKTSYRLSQKSAKNDPTDMLGHSSTNGHCIAMSVSWCGLWWLLPMLQRMRVRRTYKLDGDFGSDLLESCCCCCCVVTQNEREVRMREEATRRWAGPASTDVYTRTGGMVYKPQQ
jgi:Cys-rich protein (TIGR01571 family)